MGKKSLTAGRYFEKIELAILIFISFGLYFIFEKTPAVDFPKEVQVQNSLESGVFFNGEILKVQKKLISNAKKSINIATYTYSSGILSKLLQKKNNEGVTVKVVAGNNKDNSAPGFNFSLFKTKYGIYHPKFMVFDSKDVLISSSNISSDDKSSNSAVLFINVPHTAEILEGEIQDISSGVLKKRCYFGCDTEIGTIFFNPGKGCMAIKKEILKSETSIKAAVYTVTTKNPVITGLKNRIRNGIDVDMIFDNWKGEDSKIVNGRALKYLSSIGGDVRYDETPSENKMLFHHKFAVIDHSTTVFGSMNWTSSGCYKNREIIIINKDPEIAEKFESFFNSYSR